MYISRWAAAGVGADAGGSVFFAGWLKACQYVKAPAKIHRALAEP